MRKNACFTSRPSPAGPSRNATQLEPLLGERVDRAIEVGGEHDEVVDRDDVVRVHGRVGDVGRG